MTSSQTSAPDPGLPIIEMRGTLASVVYPSRISTPATSTATCARLAAAFPGFARNPDCYAVAVRHPTGPAGEGPNATAEIDVLERQRLAWLLECFSKPTVHLIDGAITGSDAGLALLGTHRVAAEGFSLALPEVANGLVPDCGIAHALARLPDHVGVFLALTGREIGVADALDCGFLTHSVPRRTFEEIEAALARAEPVDPLLDDLHVEPEPSTLARDRAVIGRCFGAATIDDMLSALERETIGSEVGAAFAAQTLRDLARAPRLALEVTLRHVREAASLDLRHVLMRDARIQAVARERLEGGLDVPGAPVTAGAIERHFAARLPFHLPTRQEMQALRV